MKILRNGKSIEKVEPAVDVSSEAVAELCDAARRERTYDYPRTLEKCAETIEALTADRDRHRTFVRSARAIVQAYAAKYPRFRWDGEMIDAMGAHAWLEAEAAEIGTMRDGGNPKVERT